MATAKTVAIVETEETAVIAAAEIAAIAVAATMAIKASAPPHPHNKLPRLHKRLLRP